MYVGFFISTPSVESSPLTIHTFISLTSLGQLMKFNVYQVSRDYVGKKVSLVC